MPIYKEYKLSITDENVKELNGTIKFKVEGINQKKVDSNLKSSIEYKPEGYKLVLTRSKEDGAKFVASIDKITKEGVDTSFKDEKILVTDINAYGMKVKTTSE
jgi:hypothetical protein